MPDMELEREYDVPVIGVDEAGRGPWAGPLAVAAFWLAPAGLDALPDGLDDSKRMSADARCRFYGLLTRSPHLHVLEMVEVDVIDRIGILNATLEAMALAAARLAARLRPDATHRVQVLVDGNRMPPTDLPARTVVRGDSKSMSIAAASVIAKHARDQRMISLATGLPHYGWHTNKGYGTRAHIEGLARHGVTPHHRRSFAPIRRLLAEG